MLLFVLFVEPEYWIESDQEIDEDVLEGAIIPPADVSGVSIHLRHRDVDRGDEVK